MNKDLLTHSGGPRGSDGLDGLLDSALRDSPGRPLITYYDDATGEQVDVSAGVLRGWATRTADLLVNGCGLGPGCRAAIGLPPHWQTAAVVFGTWSAGMTVDFRLAATAGLARTGTGADLSIDAVFMSVDRINDIIEEVPDAPARFALGLGPTAAPLDEVPAGFRDYVAEILRHGTAFQRYAPPLGSDPVTLDGTTYREFGSVAAVMAERWGIGPGDRVLIDAGASEHPLLWLLPPMAVGATVVLCANLDPGTVEAKARAEAVTLVL